MCALVTGCCELLKNHVPLDVVTTCLLSQQGRQSCELLKNHVPLDVVTTDAELAEKKAEL